MEQLLTLDVTNSHLDLLRKEIGCDVTFVVGPEKEKIHCHKSFLMSRSDVFRVMFEKRWANTEVQADKCSECDQIESVVVLSEVEAPIFRAFLRFIYADKLPWTSVEQTEKLLYLADKYNILKLVIKCEEFLKSALRLDSVLRIYLIGDLFNLTSLVKLCREMIANNFLGLMADPSFMSMDAKLLELVVSSHDTVISEIALFRGLIRWAEARCEKSGTMTITGESLRAALGGVLFHVRFPLMNIQDFRYVVVPSKVLTDLEKSTIYDYIALNIFDRQTSGCGRFNSIPRKANVIPQERFVLTSEDEWYDEWD